MAHLHYLRSSDKSLQEKSYLETNF